MSDNQLQFEPTRSFAYHLARYTILPEVTKIVENRGAEPFLLREIAWPIIDRLLTPEQQAVRIPRAKAEGYDKMASIIRFYVNFLAKGLNLYKSTGNGYFCIYSEDDITEEELVDEAIESGDENADDYDGWIYAYSFPMLEKADAPFPIKIGKTTGTVEDRVFAQLGAAAFEQPNILSRWQVKRVGPTELALHNVLKARGKWRENAPGREWFDTTISEVESIINFVKKED